MLFSDGTFSDGTFSDGMFSDMTFNDGTFSDGNQNIYFMFTVQYLLVFRIRIWIRIRMQVRAKLHFDLDPDPGCPTIKQEKFSIFFYKNSNATANLDKWNTA